MSVWLRCVLASLLLFTTAAAAADLASKDLRLPDAPINERVINVEGDPSRPVSLEVTLFTPPGPGPFPLAVLNHGADKVSATNRGPRYRYTFSADYFLSRGYAVALPMARGFAESGGTLFVHRCDLDQVGLANARDLRAVMAAIGHEPGIDANRIIVAGQSFGGWTTLALGTLDVAGMRGLVAFVPALRESDCISQDDAMISGAGIFGARAKVPSLWFYGDNDTVMPTRTWHAVFDAYTGAGGHAELVSIGRFMQDSHQMLTYPESMPIWVPRVDAFLAKIGLPSAETHPEYLPLPLPSPSHWAAIDDVAAVPAVNEAGRAAYRQFLTRKFPRVFVLGSEGIVSVANGGFDPLARALRVCRNAGHVCRPYAVDDQIVWTGEAAPPLVFAGTVKAGVMRSLNFAFAVNPDCSSKGLPQLRVSQMPAHGTTSIQTHDGHPHFGPASPLAVCNDSLVRGASVIYTPAPGYTGPDQLTFEEISVEGGHQAYHLNMTVVH